MLYKSTPPTLSSQDTKKRDRKRDNCTIRHYLLFYFIVLLVSRAHLGKRTLSLPRLLWSSDIVVVVTYKPFCSDLVLLFLLTLPTGVGTVMQFSYFSVISQFTHYTLQPYRNFLTVPPPPPYTKLQVGKKIGVHLSNIVYVVKRGVGPVWIGKRPGIVDLIRFCLI